MVDTASNRGQILTNLFPHNSEVRRRATAYRPMTPNDLVTIEDLALSSIWGIAALVEVLEQKSVLNRNEI